MRAIILLIGLGLLTVLAGAGCEEYDEHHREGYHSGAYDNCYRGDGHDEYEGRPGYITTPTVEAVVDLLGVKTGLVELRNCE